MYIKEKNLFTLIADIRFRRKSGQMSQLKLIRNRKSLHENNLMTQNEEYSYRTVTYLCILL